MPYQIKSKILLVDDEPTFREAYQELFEELGWWVFTADSFEAASNLLNKHYFHAATLDVRLVDDEEHNEQGMHLLDRIFKSQEPTGAVIITGFPTNERYRAAFLPAVEQNRQVDFLEKKGLDDDKLVEALTKAYLFAQNRLEEQRSNISLEDLKLKENLYELGGEIAREATDFAERIFIFLYKILYPTNQSAISEHIDRSGDFPMFSITFWSRIFGSAHTIKIGHRTIILNEKTRLEKENVQPKIDTRGSISGILYPENNVTDKLNTFNSAE